jgi:sugar phosphate isomerase/epimerase
MNRTSRRDILRGAAFAGIGLAASPSSEAMEPVVRLAPQRLKLSIAAYSFRDELKATPPKMTLLGDYVDFAVQHGLDAIEPTSYYFPEPIATEFLLALKRKAFLHGLDISGTAIGNTFTHPKGAERDKEIQHTKDWIDYAAILGTRSIRVFAGKIQDGSNLEEARKNAIECLEETCAYAATKGVFLSLENHGGIVDSPENMLPIVKAVKSDWFGVNLDTGNFNTEDPYADIAKLAPYAVTVQVKVEVNPGGRGKVPADLKRVMDILKGSGYRGYVALEYEAAEDARTAVPRYLEELKKLL